MQGAHTTGGTQSANEVKNSSAGKKKPEADSIFNALDNMMNYNIHIEDKNRTRHTNPKTENKYPDKRTNENGKSTNRKPTFYMFIFRVLKNIT